ncbi:MAG: hypothetical protein ACRDS0_11990 [Pseudonocardiaceae bacterium]
MDLLHAPVRDAAMMRGAPVRTFPWWEACAAVGGVGGALVYCAAHRSLIDDSYITLDYARTFAHYGQWALEPGHQANAATSPLNVILLAGLIVLTGAPVVSVGILLVVALTVTGAALSVTCTRLRRSQWLAAMGVSLLVLNPLLISTIGLETYLGVALIAVLGATAVVQRPMVTGVVCGLLVLTRADLAAFALAALVLVIAQSPAQHRSRHAAQVIGVAGLVALPWFAASWWWLGSAVPDTLLFKISETWAGNSFAVGLWHYALAYPVATGLSVLPAAMGLVVLTAWSAGGLRQPSGAHQRGGPVAELAVVWGFGAILHLTVFLQLRPPPYHWYYGPAIGALTMLAVVGIDTSYRVLRWTGATAALLCIATTMMFLAARSWAAMPISTSWASASQYAALAARVPSGTTVEAFGEVGTVAYFCDCVVVDRFSDRAQVADLLRAKRATAGPVVRTLLDWNYHRFKADPPIHAFYMFEFAEDPTGIAVTSPWRPYAGQMVVRPAN